MIDVLSSTVEENVEGEKINGAIEGKNVKPRSSTVNPDYIDDIGTVE